MLKASVCSRNDTFSADVRDTSQQQESPRTLREAKYDTTLLRAGAVRDQIRDLEQKQSRLIDQRQSLGEMQYNTIFAQIKQELNKKRNLMRGLIEELHVYMSKQHNAGQGNRYGPISRATRSIGLNECSS